MKMNPEKEGLNALITGASSGIGAECAAQLHSRGVNVILVARREERLSEIASVLNAKRANSARFLTLDLCDHSALQRLEEFITHERIDILVNNAGRGSFGMFEEIPLETELELVSLNIAASVAVAHAVISQMKARRSGVIISVSSVAAFQPLPYMSTYAATKAFNFHHSLALRHELAPFGVKVVVLCPGPTATEFGGVARVPGFVTNMARDSVSDVVRDCLRAVDRNIPFVVPGLKSRLLSIASRVLPVSLSTWITERMLAPVLREAKRIGEER